MSRGQVPPHAVLPVLVKPCARREPDGPRRLSGVRMPVTHLAVGAIRPVGIRVRVGAAPAAGMRTAERVGHGGVEAGALHGLSLPAFLPIKPLRTVWLGMPQVRTQIAERDAECLVQTDCVFRPYLLLSPTIAMKQPRRGYSCDGHQRPKAHAFFPAVSFENSFHAPIVPGRESKVKNQSSGSFFRNLILC